MVNYRNDPESQQPFQAVNHQYGSTSINANSYYAAQEHQHHHHHNYGRNNCIHFVQIALQLLHIVTPFLLSIVTPDGISDYVSDCAWFLAVSAMAFFWAYGGLGFIVHVAETIRRCCRDAPRDHDATSTSLVWHYVKFISHVLVTIVFTVWTIVAAPEWFSEELKAHNRWVVVIAVLQTIWVAISAILEFVLIRRVRAHQKHLEEAATAQQRELPATTHHTANPYGSY